MFLFGMPVLPVNVHVHACLRRSTWQLPDLHPTLHCPPSYGCRQTNIFVRVQIRIIGPIQLAVLLSVLLLDLVPSVQVC